VQFTQGFNPRPRLSLPLPRSVGVGTFHDRVRIVVENDFCVASMLDKLKAVAPFEMELGRAWVSPANRLERVESIEYQIDLTGYVTETIAIKIEEILRGPCLVTRRVKRTKQNTTVDLRPWLLELALEENCVRAKVAYTDKGSIKPGELLGLLELPVDKFMGKMTRAQIYWSETPSVT
jgi:radical SAM-linked protein